ncbi:hypothetical protein SAMN05216583_103185 [Selenomonas sp. KH1T6]|nr:hypothetical protein SAMN05216583_103185 [Selenomonas ruminantium]
MDSETESLMCFLRSRLGKDERLYWNGDGRVRVCNEITGKITDFCAYRGCVLNLTTGYVECSLPEGYQCN